MTVPLPPLSLQYKFAAFVAQVDNRDLAECSTFSTASLELCMQASFSVADTD